LLESTYPEQLNTAAAHGWNTQFNNNIAWHNLHVEPVQGGKYVFKVQQPKGGAKEVRLRFDATTRNGAPWGDSTVTVDLGKLYPLWVKGGRQGEGIRPTDGTRLRLIGPHSNIRISPVPFGKYELLVNWPVRPPDVLRISHTTDSLFRTGRMLGGVTVKSQQSFETALREKELKRRQSEERIGLLKLKRRLHGGKH
jgi:hypothetical protein